LVDNSFCKLAKKNVSRINVILKALVYASHSQQNIWGTSSLAPICQIEGSIPLAWICEDKISNPLVKRD
jgi:hypothetical protein